MRSARNGGAIFRPAESDDRVGFEQESEAPSEHAIVRR
jgi:hypothetical protein